MFFDAESSSALTFHVIFCTISLPLRIASGGVWVWMVTDAPLSNVIAVGCREVSAFSRWRRARGHFQREFKQMHPRPPLPYHVSVQAARGQMARADRDSGAMSCQTPACVWAVVPGRMPTSPEGESEIIKAEYTHKHFYYKSHFHFYISYFLEALDAKIYFICTFQAFFLI